MPNIERAPLWVLLIEAVEDSVPSDGPGERAMVNVVSPGFSANDATQRVAASLTEDGWRLAAVVHCDRYEERLRDNDVSDLIVELASLAGEHDMPLFDSFYVWSGDEMRN